MGACRANAAVGEQPFDRMPGGGIQFGQLDESLFASHARFLSLTASSPRILRGAMRCVIIIIAVGQDCVTILEIRLKMTKESDARENIDRLLEQAGWSVCDAARAAPRRARRFCGNIKTQDATPLREHYINR
jgi:hypothetical protein